MQTPIAGSFQQRHNKRRWAVIALIATLALAADFAIISTRRPSQLDARAILAAGALGLFICLAPAASHDLGLRLTPLQGIRHWLKVGSILLAIVVAWGLVASAVLLSGYLWRVPPMVAPKNIPRAFLYMCIIYPVLEELLYRLILCAPITALSPKAAIVVSGAAFALLHFVYGNPGPDNFVAGYFLAWAYLKSGSIVVPILLHSCGNAIALGVQAFAWYVLHG